MHSRLAALRNRLDEDLLCRRPSSRFVMTAGSRIWIQTPGTANLFLAPSCVSVGRHATRIQEGLIRKESNTLPGVAIDCPDAEKVALSRLPVANESRAAFCEIVGTAQRSNQRGHWFADSECPGRLLSSLA